MRIRCPMCGQVVEAARQELPTRPFCSRRCKLLDLNNWLNERYRLSEPAPPDDEEAGLH